METWRPIVNTVETAVSAAIALLSIIADHLRRRFAQLKLVAHFLEARGESFNLLLLLGLSRRVYGLRR
jgi:hypothetical protein